MGMAAGSTAVPGNFDPVCGRHSLPYFNQISVITGKFRKTPFCPAERAGVIGTGVETGQILFKPLAVRKRNLIQLAKNSKYPYHKSGGCPVCLGQRFGAGEGHFGRCGFSLFGAPCSALLQIPSYIKKAKEKSVPYSEAHSRRYLSQSGDFNLRRLRCR